MGLLNTACFCTVAILAIQTLNNPKRQTEFQKNMYKKRVFIYPNGMLMNSNRYCAMTVVAITKKQRELIDIE